MAHEMKKDRVDRLESAVRRLRDLAYKRERMHSYQILLILRQEGLDHSSPKADFKNSEATASGDPGCMIERPWLRTEEMT